MFPVCPRETSYRYNSSMKSEKLNQYRRILHDLRERVGGEVNHVVEAIREDVTINENVSFAPVHLADVAGAAVDADVAVLHAERDILQEIEAALRRLDEGTFGECRNCGAAISEERLRAIPYASVCASCAKATEESAGLQP
jgi:RNA polymerase-binding transcription factor DksA